MSTLFSGLLPASGGIYLECRREGGEDSFAFPCGKDAHFVIFCPRDLAVTEGNAVFFRDGSADPVCTAPLHWERTQKGYDTYSFAFPRGFEAGLYFFSVCLSTPEGKRYVISCGNEAYSLSDTSGTSTRHFLLYRRDYPQCRWLYGGAIYQIFVDRFFRGDDTPLADGAIRNNDWDNGIPQYPAYPGAPLANNMFFGGNLSGIVRKLPYLASLGITCLYLSPIFKAASNHKYDTGDYLEIDPSFGSEETLKDLIARAEKLGIRVILDGVFNHTGDDSLYFNRYGHYPGTGAYQSKKSPYAGWYHFRHFPDRYDCWWDIPILPKLNLQNPDTRTYFLGENGVIAHYARLGIGGIRLDVADELDDEFIASVKSRLHEACPDAVLYGEVWEDASDKIAYGQRKRYYYGRELDGVMNYPLRTGLLSYIRTGETGPLTYALTGVMRNCPPECRNTLMNFLGTHDTERVLSALGDLSYENKSNDEIARMKMTPSQRQTALGRLRLAFAALIALPGVPCIYYGDEAGMEGYKDPFNRLPFPWNHADPELQKYVAEWISERRRHKVFTDGRMHILRLDGDCFAFSRTKGMEKIVVIVNRSQHPFCFEPDAPCRLLVGGIRTAGRIVILPCSACMISADHVSEAHLFPFT